MQKYYVSLEIGGTNLRYGIIDNNMEVVTFNKIPTKYLSEEKDKVGYLSTIIDKMIQKVGIKNIEAITMALASLMDKNRTIIYSSPMIKNFNNIAIVDELESAFKIPVVIEKDVNLLLLYEINKAKIDKKGIIIGVFIGTGLGNAMCINGQIYKGYSGAACELGHIPVPNLDIMCGCGKKGCIEVIASGNALHRLATEKYKCHVSQIFQKYGEESDVKNVVYYSALAIATEITILDPTYLFLGGGVIKMDGFPMDFFIQSIRDNLRTPHPRESLKIYPASGDEEAGIVGAAIYADQFLNLK